MDPAAMWPPQAIEAVKDVLTTTRTYTSCLYTLLVWEFITTWRLEYCRFWKAQWTPLKVAFLACRYWTLGLVTMIMVFFNGTISAESCKSLHFLLPGFTIILFVICNCIIGLRVYALYERQIWILAVFGVLICGEVIMSAYAIAYDAPVPMPPGEHACISNSTERNLSYFWLYWLAPVLFDSVAIVLIIARSFIYYTRANDSRLPIINMLLSHGILYFLVVLAANLLNVIWYRTRSPTDNQALHSPLAIVVTSVACSRLCFSLKDPKNLQAGSNSGGASRFNTVNGSGSGSSKVVPAYTLSTLRKNPATASTERPANGDSSELLDGVNEKSFAEDAASDVEKNVPFNVIAKNRKETSVGSAYRGVEVTTAVYRSTD